MERRSEARIEIEIYVDCRVPALPLKGMLLDVSRQGCRLRMLLRQVEVGSTVLLDLPGSQQFPGTVVWLSKNQAGIKFDRPLRKSTAIALGVEDSGQQPVSELVQVEVPAPTGGLLRHWIRQITATLT